MDGFKGEAEVYQSLVKYGNVNWVYLHDIWIYAGRTTQLDLVVLSGSGVYIIDAKNYATEFAHQYQQALANGELLNKSIKEEEAILVANSSMVLCEYLFTKYKGLNR
ncbi:NERD domain-containing protein [Aerococcaceae bacterium INB8]|uniref:NERD domain-containing protein n=1 Tax=Ruoffia halotolerans TaxID=2748684 RepID=A0A839A5M6_9LACT|nr:nuclease-related domain-containing protein [Ruoffia halotolerans]MBA5729302.1 NERD domain-containing protein [Ruoffia halotolerans]